MATTFKVVTWNLENLLPGEGGGPNGAVTFDRKPGNRAATILDLAPDVLAVQEVGSEAAFGGSYPHARGNVYVASRVASNANVNAERSSTLRKFSPAGSLLWSRHLFSDLYPVASSTATTASGETFVAVQHEFLAKYSSTGELLFKKPLTGSAAAAGDLDVAPDGSLYTAGDSWLVKYSSTGEVLWQRAVPMERVTGDLIAVGVNSVYYGATNSEVNRIRLYKYTANGGLVWKRYFRPVNAIPALAALSADDKGNVHMAGGLVITGGEWRDWTSFVWKYTPSGGVAWTYQPPLSGSGYDYAFGISAADSGRSYVVGVTSGPVNGTDYGGTDAYLLRLDTGGKEVWQR